MQELRKRRSSTEEMVEEEKEETETITPLEDCISNYWEMGTFLDGFSVSIRPPVIEMPLLKRLGAASFVPDPGIESLLRAAYQTVERKAIQIAFQEQEGENNKSA